MIFERIYTIQVHITINNISYNTRQSCASGIRCYRSKSYPQKSCKHKLYHTNCQMAQQFTPVKGRAIELSDHSYCFKIFGDAFSPNLSPSPSLTCHLGPPRLILLHAPAKGRFYVMAGRVSWAEWPPQCTEKTG